MYDFDEPPHTPDTSDTPEHTSDPASDPEPELATKRRLRRRFTRDELILTIILLVLVVIICVYGIPVLWQLFETIQFDTNSTNFILSPLL